LKEIIGGDFAPAGGPLRHDAPAQEHKHHRKFGRRIGMAQAADNGAAVADGNMRNVRQCFGDERIGFAHALIQFQLAVARHRLDDDLTAFDADAFEARDVLNVDEKRRARETEVHCREQALPAGQHHGILVAGKCRDRLADGLGCSILKDRRLHLLPNSGGLRDYPECGYDVYRQDTSEAKRLSIVSICTPALRQ